MPSARDTALPFFDETHRALASQLASWLAAHPPHPHGESRDETDAACRRWVADLGRAGWLRYAVPAGFGGALPALDSRALVLIRETLAAHNGLADFAFAMQGLGTGAITLAGSQAIRSRYLPAVAEGTKIAAFALSEPQAGSDVAAMTTRARRAGESMPGSAGGGSSAEADFGLGLPAVEPQDTGGRADDWILDGCKTWISNGGIADFYCVFARTSDAPGARGITAFVVDAATPGLAIEERIDVMAPHPLATLRFSNCRVPDSHRLGEVGAGFKLAMATLDIFRASVAGAAIGFARHALAEAGAYAARRPMFGATLSDLQLTQAALGEMAAAIDASALLTYRAAWLRDVQGERTTMEAAMAKMAATESAQQVIDRAVQMFGGLGVRCGMPVEKLYREIRSLRIYEGATEVQKLIIGREWLKTANA